MSEAKPSTLYARINLVKKDVVRVKKTGKNQHFGYMFATESDICDTLRPLMAEHGVCLVYHGPDPDKFKMLEAGKTKSGAEKFRYCVWCKYSVVNADDAADRFETWGYGEALDQEDKGHNKAITNAHKYVLIKLFDVSTGDLAADPDTYGHGDEREAPPAQRPVAPRAASTATNGAAASPRKAFLARVQKWSGVNAEDVRNAASEIKKKCGITAEATDADLVTMGKWMDAHTWEETIK